MLKCYGVLFSLCTVLLTNAAEETEHVPPVEKWISAESVQEEYQYVQEQRSEAGGQFDVISQNRGDVGDKHFDQLVCQCRISGDITKFTFDATELFKQQEAKEKAFQYLDQKYPEISEKQLPELKQLLSNENPHFISWSVEKIASLKTEASDKVLFDAYINYGLGESYYRGEKLLIGRSDAIVPLIEQQLANEKPEITWHLLWMLGDIKTPRCARAIETELQYALEHRPDDIRACCVVIGNVGNRGSEEILLRAFAIDPVHPDDSIIWALGRCGGNQSIARVRRLMLSDDEKVRAAAVAAIGNLGVKSEIARLIYRAEKAETHNERSNAIYSLGRLQAREAVPLLLHYLRQDPQVESRYRPSGLFGRDSDTWEGNHIETSINALARIDDRRALPEFRRILKDERYSLYCNDIAAAAAELGWTELVPDILDRFEKKHTFLVSVFGPDFEYFSPSLRKLTGQSIGEDPQAWRRWYESAKGDRRSISADQPLRALR